MTVESRRYETVSQITDRIKRSLEADFGNVFVQGEISNFRPSAAGHLYFTLKDEDAIISLVMFRGRAARLKFRPADGNLVRVFGSVSVYAKRGNYQIICESMEIAGEGNLLAMLEERKRRLHAEGLFAQERKSALPMFPRRVAVITSPTGAALRDIMRVLSRRHAGVDIVVLPTLVQGADAAENIAGQIGIANTHCLGDVIIVGRGGGSLEDLLPFSEEVVVRSVAASSIPVISAVGHEVDTSLSDLAADVCAPTPSAAAEMVCSSREEVLSRVVSMRDSIFRALTSRLERTRMLVDQFSKKNLERNFRLFVQPILLRVDDAKEDLLHGMERLTTERRHAFAMAKTTLESLSPLAIMEKGYAVVTREEAEGMVRSVSDLEIDDGIRIRFHSGRATARITGKEL